MEDYQKRLLNECKELQDKIHKLYNFILSDNFKKLDEEKQKLLKEQHKVMLHYERILFARLKLEGFSFIELKEYLKCGEI